MKKVPLLLSVSLVLLFGAAMASAQTTKSHPAESTAAQENWDSFKPVTLTGTISIVDASQKLVVLTFDSIPYDITVTKATKILIGGSKATFSDLENQTQKEASITFVARPTGNYAQSITISE